MSELPPALPSTILAPIARYYADRLRRYGTTARGVDWNSEESQRLRFVKLLSVVDQDPAARPVLNDYGCGYGALLDVLREARADVTYRGYDISEEMIAAARSSHQAAQAAIFTADAADLQPATWSVASGIFNVRLDYPDAVWFEYVMQTLSTLDRLSERAFAFNMLTTYSDPGKRRADLYYADPHDMFRRCRQFSPRVALLHDYPLYEFTIVVRK
jgi:SAM-dependent methyltransferase